MQVPTGPSVWGADEEKENRAVLDQLGLPRVQAVQPSEGRSLLVSREHPSGRLYAHASDLVREDPKSFPGISVWGGFTYPGRAIPEAGLDESGSIPR